MIHLAITSIYVSTVSSLQTSVSKCLIVNGCQPISIWVLLRHGQRYPGAYFAQYMKEAMVIKDYILSSHEKGNCSLCAQDVENLSKWQGSEELYNHFFELTEEGYQEAKGVGHRLKQAFPKLLAKLGTNDYLVRPAPEVRLLDSAKAFVEGLYDEQLTIDLPMTDNDILSSYKRCAKYLTEVKYNSNFYAESVKYLSSSEYLSTKDRIQRRLGINYPLTDVNITALYDLCRYTSSGVTGKFSPWCALFTAEDLRVIEYYYDLRTYFRNGYGSPTNELFGQIILSDLLKNFQEAKNGNGRKITSYITHATMLDMVFTALKLFQDNVPLTSLRRDPDRKWRSSKVAVLSSNLIVVLNKCNNETDDYNVGFYLNEESLLSIGNKGVCTWKEFEDKLSPFLKTNTDFCDS